MSCRLELLDKFGAHAGTIGGVAVTGPLLGYKGLHFTPTGACIDKAGQCAFDLPMTLRANFGMAPGTMVRVVDSTWGEQGIYVVGDRSESLSADGHWASFTCYDLVFELTWQTVPGFTALPTETTAATLGRLLAIATETTWTYRFMDSGDGGFAGVGYSADAVNIQQAYDKLLKDRFYHWRRGVLNPAAPPAPLPPGILPPYPPPVGGGVPNPRLVEAGLFGRRTGIRLVRPSMRPGAMDRPTIRPILPGGLTHKEDLTGVDNCIIPTGGGSGFAQLTLEPLFNPAGAVAVPGTNWTQSGPPLIAGQDPNYPVYRRIRYDGGGLDGEKYFLSDPASVAAYRQHWFDYPRTDIGVISNTTADLQAAALALYQTTLAYLKWHNTLNDVLSITTDGRGTNVGIGGDLVRVEYREMTRGVTTLDIDGDYQVVDLARAVSDTDGSYTDTWTVSNLGRDAASGTAVTTGLAQSITQLRNEVAAYPQERDIHYDQPVNATTPCNVTVNLNAGVQRVVQASFSVQLLPIYSTVTSGTVAAHHHTVPIPALSVGTVIPAIYEGDVNFQYGNQFGHTHIGAAGQFNHGHTTATGQFSHAHGASSPATLSGGVSAGTASDVTQAIRSHIHTILVGGGGTPSSLGDSIVYVRPNPYHFQASNNAQGQISTDAPGTWSPAAGGHPHGNSFAAGGGGTVDGNANGGFQPGIDANGGFSPTTPAFGGGVPQTAFPGYNGASTIPTSTQTSSDVAPAFTPVYGIFNDPAGRASGVTVQINGVTVVAPFSDAVKVLDLTPYIGGQQPIVVTFASATLGRLVIDGIIRTITTTYGIGP